MGEALHQRNLPQSLTISREAEAPEIAPAHALKPTYRLTPRHNGSTLYDSYEFRAVTEQLNKAMQSLNSSSPTFMSYLKSPFYSHRLDSIYKENSETQKRIMCSRINQRYSDKKASRKGSRVMSGGFASRLWKKIKEGLLWSK
ncbi:conserved hypothetical protein [Ricinus communis]|uniref:Uncharacterized protein n=1 Tax=Ricinus communis TaxID=3988 RepID=B9RLR6_RICCO|nr:conserved hypothetical protein [Ricinus communis]